MPIINNEGNVLGILGISIIIDSNVAQSNALGKMFNELIDFLPAHIYWKDKSGVYLVPGRKRRNF